MRHRDVWGCCCDSCALLCALEVGFAPVNHTLGYVALAEALFGWMP